MEEFRNKVSWKLLELQSQLTSNNTSNKQLLLNECKLWFQPKHYEDIIEERCNQRLCGYPICNNHIRLPNEVNDQYRINYKTKKIYQIDKSKYYCSINCLEQSLLYLSTLDTSNPEGRSIANKAEVKSPNKLEEVLTVIDNIISTDKEPNNNDNPIVNDIIDEDDNDEIKYPSLPPYNNHILTTKGQIKSNYVYNKKDQFSSILDLSDVKPEVDDSTNNQTNNKHMNQLINLIEKSNKNSKISNRNVSTNSIFISSTKPNPKHKPQRRIDNNTSSNKSNSNTISNNNKIKSDIIISNDIIEKSDSMVKPIVSIVDSKQSINELSINRTNNDPNDLKQVTNKLNRISINHPAFQPTIIASKITDPIPESPIVHSNTTSLVNDKVGHVTSNDNHSISNEKTLTNVIDSKVYNNNTNESVLKKSILDILQSSPIVNQNNNADIQSTNDNKLEVIDLCNPVGIKKISVQDRIDYPEWFNDWDKYNEISSSNSSKYRSNKIKKNVTWNNDNIGNNNKQV